MIMEMKIDKQNGYCAYNDELHKYVDTRDGKPFISVTTLIHKYCADFDEDFWSMYKGLEVLNPSAFASYKKDLLNTKKYKMEDLINVFNASEDEIKKHQQDILDAWKKKTEEACARGTAIHAEKENVFYEKPKHDLSRFNLSGEYTCKKDYYELDQERGAYPEYLVYFNDKEVKIAGQVDLLIKDGNEITIIDYKTNAKLDSKSYYDNRSKKHQCMKYPLSNIMDCNLMHYTIQLSMYAYMVKQLNPEFVIKKLMIIHYDHDGGEHEYVLDYKEAEVIKLIKDHRKNVIAEERAAKKKKIVY